MHKEITRKEFVATLAFGMASILGVSTITHLLTGKTFPSPGVHPGYSSSPYGRGGESQAISARDTKA
jgi:hypothetical protein